MVTQIQNFKFKVKNTQSMKAMKNLGGKVKRKNHKNTLIKAQKIRQRFMVQIFSQKCSEVDLLNRLPTSTNTKIIKNIDHQLEGSQDIHREVDLVII